MAVLRIDWKSESRVAPDTSVVTPRETDGKGEEGAPAAVPVKRASKPMLVYIAEPGVADATFDKVEKVKDPVKEKMKK